MTDSTLSSESEISTRRFCAVLLTVLSCLYVAHVLFRYFDRDEFEAVHTAWLMLKGHRIYTDFFQHHHEACYHLLAAMLELTGDSVPALYALRAVFGLMSAGIVWTAWMLSRLVFADRTQALISVTLLLGTEMFASSAIEIRPDVPQVLCGMASLVLLQYRLRGAPKLCALLAGLFMGLAVLVLQKAVVVLAIYVLVMILAAGMRRLTLPDIVLFLTGVLFPVGGYVVWLWFIGGLSSYFFWNWTLNLNFCCPDADSFFVWQSFALNALTWLMFGLGILRILRERLTDAYPLAVSAVGLLLSVGLYHVRYPQYFLHFFPVMAVIAAHGAAKWRDRCAVLVLLIACLGGGIKLGVDLANRSNGEQLERVRYVLENTDPQDRVYDGNAAFNLFREDIDFFWFSVRPICSGLETYSRITGYRYDIIDRIVAVRPRVVASAQLHGVTLPLAGYVCSPVYPDLLMRKESAVRPLHEGSPKFFYMPTAKNSKKENSETRACF